MLRSARTGCQALTVDQSWRQWLRRNIAWMLLLKLAALILLKNLFFSSEHRLHVTPDRVDSQLALHAGAATLFPVSRENTHD